MCCRKNCSNPSVVGFKCCQEHLNKLRSARKQRIDPLDDEPLCIQCHINPQEIHKNICTECLIKNKPKPKPSLKHQPLSPYTKLNQFADVLSLDMANIVLDYAYRAPKIPHADIEAWSVGKLLKKCDKTFLTTTRISEHSRFYQELLYGPMHKYTRAYKVINRYIGEEIERTFWDLKTIPSGIIFYNRNHAGVESKFTYDFYAWTKADEYLNRSFQSIRSCKSVYKWLVLASTAYNGIKNFKFLNEPEQLQDVLRRRLMPYIIWENANLFEVPISMRKCLYKELVEGEKVSPHSIESKDNPHQNLWVRLYDERNQLVSVVGRIRKLEVYKIEF